MKLWSDFHDLIMPDVPGCPLVMADSALRQSTISFCEQSLAWKYKHPPIAVAAGTAEYAFVPPSDAVVHAVTYAELDGREISAQAGETDIKIAGWSNRTGKPEYVLGGATSLTLLPEPAAAGTLALTVALKPSSTAAGIDDSMFNEYSEAILHGALARLMLSPSKPYTNLQLAQYHAQQSAIHIAVAGIRVAKGYARAPLQTRIMRRA